MYRKFPTYIRQNTLLSWNKKRLRNKSEIFDIYRKFPIFIHDKIHSKLEQKMLTKSVGNFRLILLAVLFQLTVNLSRGVTKKNFFSKRRRAPAVWKNTVYFVTLHDKYAASWNKKICEISWKFTIGFFAPTYSVFVVKCNKINSIFPNGGCATPFGKNNHFFVTSRDNYTVS